jgi:hypothetical protein
MTISTMQRPANMLGTFTVIDPTTPPKQIAGNDRRGVAPRVDTLDGKVLAIIDNQMGSSAILATALLDRLNQTYDMKDVIWVKKPSVSVPPRSEDWARVTADADVGIALFGGCGSCTSRAVRDAIEMEWSGIPSVAIVHEMLVGSADAMRKMSQMPAYPVVEVGLPAAPTSTWTPEQLAIVLDAIFDEVVGRLVSVSGSAE